MSGVRNLPKGGRERGATAALRKSNILEGTCISIVLYEVHVHMGNGLWKCIGCVSHLQEDVGKVSTRMYVDM